MAIASTAILVPTKLPLATGISALCLCIFSITQYKWSRAHSPDPTNSFYFSKLDKKDYSAAVLLITGILGGYFFSQFALYEILKGMVADFTFQFKSGQSLILNIGAILLMYIALKERNKEIIIIATVVAVLGGVKVFILDMFSIKGIPLVLSVFSYGIVAAFGSVVMSKWQKKEAEPA